MKFKNFLTSLIAIPTMGFACHLVTAQQPATPPTDSSGAMVSLEPHARQTQFKIGDPITVDLVFASKSHGYAIRYEGSRFNAPLDLVNVTPTTGWFRSAENQSGGSPEDMGLNPVRISVLVNRNIVFRQPGHYEITITTDRLVPSSTGAPAQASAANGRLVDLKKTTNAVGIDILPRDEHEESALVAQLSRELEKAPEPVFSDAWTKQHESLLREVESQLEKPTAYPQRENELSNKLQAFEAEAVARSKKQAEVRQTTAIRLSYLQGDDAVRAKVRWLLADKGDGTSDIGLAMLNGLASSRNLTLQMQLLQSAWDDAGRIHTDLLQSALQQAKALLQNSPSKVQAR